VTPSTRLLAVLALAAVFAAVLPGAAHASTPRDPDQVALLWGDRYFTDPSELALWLAARGATYGVWAERHPGAAELLEWAAAERARRGVPQGTPFRGVPERGPAAVLDPQPIAVPLAEGGISLPATLAIAALLLGGVVFGNAFIRRTGRRGLDPITLAVSGAGLAASIFLVVFVANARF
jgi:hypothetical protein